MQFVEVHGQLDGLIPGHLDLSVNSEPIFCLPKQRVCQALARCFFDQYFLSIFVYREDPEWALSRYAFKSIKERLEMVYIVSGACALKS